MRETELLVRYKIFFLFLFLTIILRGQEYPDKNVHGLLTSGIEKIITQDYNSANIIFNKLNNQYPELPLGKIYLAAVEIAKSYDFGEEYNTFKIEALLNESETLSETLLKKDSENIWNWYFMGLVKGYLSYFQVLKGSWLLSLKNGLSSASWLENCVNKQPDFFEAYSGLGSYKYWKSRKIEFLSWLPFVKYEKNEGISLLENAVNHSFYNTYLAVNSLIWIYIDAKDYNKAVKVAEQSLKKYPQSRFFKWGLARAYEDVNPRMSMKYYYEILDSYPDLTSLNHVNEVTLKYLIAQQYYKIGENSKALSLLEQIFRIKSMYPKTVDLLSDRFRKADELYKKIIKKR